MSEKINLNFSVYVISKITGSEFLLGRFRWLCDAELFQNVYNETLTDLDRNRYYVTTKIEDSFNE